MSSSNLFPICPTMRAEAEQAHCCGQKLLTQKTEARSVVTLSVGKIHIHETVKHCACCKQVYRAPEVAQLVPQHCNFGFDVMTCVGEAVFQKHRTELEVVSALKERNVSISERQVSVLANKFVCYLSIAHKHKATEIQQLIQSEGGFCLHFDGTTDGSSPHLLLAVDEGEQLVLEAVKAPSESKEAVGCLLRQVKHNYGTPLALVHDMGKSNLSAAAAVFPEVNSYICHFHFLRDIGKDLFGYEDARIRSILHGHGIKGRLQALAKKLRPFANTECLNQEISPTTLGALSDTAAAYLLVEWILDFSNELSGYGFPFDRERLILIQRMWIAYKSIPKTIPSHSYLHHLRSELAVVFEDSELLKLTSAMEAKVKHFERLRKALRIADPNGTDGLNDDGIQCDMQEMQVAVDAFVQSEEILQLAVHDLAYKKLLAQIKKYKNKLFSKPITRTLSDGRIVEIQPQRTNNLMERIFREMNRGYRKRAGYKSLGRILTTMIAEAPLVKNLENEDYVRIILNGNTTLAACFAEIEAKLVRDKIKQATEAREMILPAIKCLIRMPKLPQTLFEAGRIRQAS